MAVRFVDEQEVEMAAAAMILDEVEEEEK